MRPSPGQPQGRRNSPDGNRLYAGGDHLLQSYRKLPMQYAFLFSFSHMKIEQIMLSPNEAYSVSSIAALREVSAVKNMSKTQAEIVLGSFVAKGWLLRSK